MAGGANNPAAARFCETELHGEVSLCLANGRLNPNAVGWSRFPLQRCNLSGGWPARKRWDFWGVLTDTHLFTLTHGATDYVGLLALGWLEYSVGRRVQATRSPLLPRELVFPETVGGASIAYRDRDFELQIDELAGATRLQGSFTTRKHQLRAELLVERPEGHQSVNVVIPWSDERFQFTSKQNTRPARGWVELDGKRYPFGPENHAYGILDFGRGVWPYNTAWNWAAASGIEGGRTIGLNLGGKWTDGTGCTENGLCVDGRVTKLSEDLVWEYDRKDFSKPWRIHTTRSDHLDLVFFPRLEETQRIELLLLRSELHWALGTFRGTIVIDSGERIELQNLLGWAEEHSARW